MKIKLYHGTSESSYHKLKEEGAKKLYLTSSQEQADYYAECAGEDNNENPIVTTVEVDISILVADRPSFDEPLSFILDKNNLSESEWHESLNSGNIPYPSVEDWKASLRYTDTVIAIGNILPNDIGDMDSSLNQNDLDKIDKLIQEETISPITKLKRK